MTKPRRSAGQVAWLASRDWHCEKRFGYWETIARAVIRHHKASKKRKSR